MQGLALQSWYFSQPHISQSCFLYSLFPYTLIYLYIFPPDCIHKHRHIHSSCVTFVLLFLWPSLPSQVIIHLNLNFVFFLTISYVTILDYVNLINWSQNYQNTIPSHICLHIKLLELSLWTSGPFLVHTRELTSREVLFKESLRLQIFLNCCKTMPLKLCLLYCI